MAQLCLGDFELLLKQCDGGMNGGPAAVGCCSADDAPKHRSSKGSCNVDLCPFGPLINLRLTFDASWPKGGLNVFAAQGPQNFTSSPDRRTGPLLQNRKGLIGGQCSKMDAVCATKPTADIVSLSRQANFCTTPDQCLNVRRGPASPDCEDNLFLDSADQFAL